MIDARFPRLLQGRHVRQKRYSLGARYREGLDLAASDELQRLRNTRYKDIDMATDEIVERRRPALVGNMHQLHARRIRDPLGRNLIDAAKAGRGVGDLA